MGIGQSQQQEGIIVIILILLTFAVVFVLTNSALTGYFGTKRVTEEVREWKQDSDYLQFPDFFIQNLTYTHNTILCENVTAVNVSIILRIGENFTYGLCSVLMDTYVVKNFVGKLVERDDYSSRTKPQETYNVTAPDVDVRAQHSVRFCCDNYCNIKSLEPLCG